MQVTKRKVCNYSQGVEKEPVSEEKPLVSSLQFPANYWEEEHSLSQGQMLRMGQV